MKHHVWGDAAGIALRALLIRQFILPILVSCPWFFLASLYSYDQMLTGTLVLESCKFKGPKVKLGFHQPTYEEHGMPVVVFSRALISLLFAFVNV